MIGIVVDLDNDPVGPGSDACASHRNDLIPDTDTVRGISEDRKMAFLLHDRNCSDVKGISRRSFECADAAFAENDLVVPTRKDVLC